MHMGVSSFILYPCLLLSAERFYYLCHKTFASAFHSHFRRVLYSQTRFYRSTQYEPNDTCTSIAVTSVISLGARAYPRTFAYAQRNATSPDDASTALSHADAGDAPAVWRLWCGHG